MISYPAYDIIRNEKQIVDLSKVCYVYLHETEYNKKPRYHIVFVFHEKTSSFSSDNKEEVALALDHYLAYLLTRNNNGHMPNT